MAGATSGATSTGVAAITGCTGAGRRGRIGLSVRACQCVPKELLVRETRVGGKVLVSTLPDAGQVDKDEIGPL